MTKPEPVFLPKPEISSRLKSHLTIAAVFNSFCLLLTPFVIRSLIDGLLPSEDKSAILVGLSVLALAELTFFVSSWTFDSKLRKVQQGYLLTLRDSFASACAQGIRRMSDFEVRKIWSSDLPQYSQQASILIWQRYRDCLAILFLVIACMHINYASGIVIILLVALQFFVSLQMEKKRGKTGWELAQAAQEVDKSLSVWFSEILRYRLTGKIGSSRRRLHASTVRANSVFDSMNAFKARSFEMQRATRSLFIILLLAWTLQASVNPAEMSGSIWALIIAIFRLGGPLGRVVSWSFTHRSEKGVEKNVVSALRADVLSVEESHPASRAMMKLINEVKGSDKRSFCFVYEHEKEAIAQALIEARFKLGFEKVKVVDRVCLEDLSELKSSTVLVLFFVSESIPGKSEAEFFEAKNLIYSHRGPCVVIDSFNWSRAISLQKSYLSKDGAARYTLERDLYGFGERMKRQEKRRHDVALLIKDIERMSRFNIKCTLYWFKYKGQQSDLKASLRKFDHLVHLGLSHYLVLFVGCPGKFARLAFEHLTSKSSLEKLTLWDFATMEKKSHQESHGIDVLQTEDVLGLIGYALVGMKSKDVKDEEKHKWVA